jgi:hypothetical protein
VQDHPLSLIGNATVSVVDAFVLTRLLNAIWCRIYYKDSRYIAIRSFIAMLDTFEILSTSGVVLWSRSFAPVNPSVINNFITDVFIEEKGAALGAKDNLSAATNPPYKQDQHTLRWTFVKELGVIFVVRTRPRTEISVFIPTDIYLHI